VPELPEVETVARQLDAVVSGMRIKHVAIHDSKLKALDTESLAGCRINAVRRYGKQIIFELIPPRKRKVAMWLAIHLRMTGRLIFRAHGKLGCYDKSQFRAIIVLNRGAVCFQDTRRFGTMAVHRSLASVLPSGVEPLSSEFTWLRLRELLGDSTTPIKNWLLRQDKLVGIGNIYASEILFGARIHPSQIAESLTRAEVKRLHRATRRILRAAIKHCGTTFSDFQDSRGQTGGYARFLKVYKREGDPCRTCGAPIARSTQAQRSTFFCPNCQPKLSR
jgi:formamidopyrimidine-DNA glycosylase